jgi:hypothetical protein
MAQKATQKATTVRSTKRKGSGEYKDESATIDAIVSEIAEMIVMGHGRSAILRYSAEKWGYKSRWTEELVARARELIAADTAEERKDSIVKGIARMEMLFLKNIQRGAYAEARKVQETLNKLMGLNAEASEREDGDANIIADAIGGLKYDTQQEEP